MRGGLVFSCAVIPTGQLIHLASSTAFSHRSSFLFRRRFKPHQIAVAARGDRFKIITGDHTSIADEDQAVEPEALVQVGDGLADGGVVHLVAGPNVMRDRPARDHHHGNDHLNVMRLAIAAVAVLGEADRPGTLEVGAGDVVEHQLGLEAEQVAEPMIEGHLDLVLGGYELIEGAVPGLELLEMDPDPLVLVPVGHESPAPAIADEVGLQPAGQAVFAGGPGEAIGDQDERPVREWHALGLAQRRVEDGPEPELVEQGADSQDRPPGGGIEDIEIVVPRCPRVGLIAEQTFQFGEDFGEQIHAAQIGHGALLDLAIVAIGFDDADILVAPRRWRTGL